VAVTDVAAIQKVVGVVWCPSRWIFVQSESAPLLLVQQHHRLIHQSLAARFAFQCS
jgi:hypothetical protein